MHCYWCGKNIEAGTQLNFNAEVKAFLEVGEVWVHPDEKGFVEPYLDFVSRCHEIYLKSLRFGLFFYPLLTFIIWNFCEKYLAAVGFFMALDLGLGMLFFPLISAGWIRFLGLRVYLYLLRIFGVLFLGVSIMFAGLLLKLW